MVAGRQIGKTNWGCGRATALERFSRLKGIQNCIGGGGVCVQEVLSGERREHKLLGVGYSAMKRASSHSCNIAHGILSTQCCRLLHVSPMLNKFPMCCYMHPQYEGQSGRLQKDEMVMRKLPYLDLIFGIVCEMAWRTKEQFHVKLSQRRVYTLRYASLLSIIPYPRYLFHPWHTMNKPGQAHSSDQLCTHAVFP